MATRFYLSATETVPVTPGFATWTRITEGDRRKMSPTKGSSAMASKTFWANQAAVANATCLARQYVSDPMPAGIAFTVGDTVRCVLRCMESAVNDNINRTPICIKVYDESGTILRATLLALLHYGPNTTEWNTALRSKQAADGDAITAGYTTVAGDRLVIEIGGQVSSSGGASVTGTQSFGEDGASDLLENETQTAALNPWFEISRNITFPQTYDETGKLQVILAAQGQASTQSMSEAARMQTILVAQGQLDAQSMMEAAKTQIILCAQGEADGLLFIETGLTQVILTLQGKTEQVVLSEMGKLALVLATQGRADIQIMLETAKSQIILATQGKQDVMTLSELGREQVILALQGRGDTLVMDESALEETLIIAQGHIDSLLMEETSKAETILVVLGEFDELIPGTIYFGILKRWNGATWVKEPLKVYLGSWQAKPLKRWDGAEWKLVDTTGV